MDSVSPLRLVYHLLLWLITYQLITVMRESYFLFVWSAYSIQLTLYSWSVGCVSVIQEWTGLHLSCVKALLCFPSVNIETNHHHLNRNVYKTHTFKLSFSELQSYDFLLLYKVKTKITGTKIPGTGADVDQETRAFFYCLERWLMAKWLLKPT